MPSLPLKGGQSALQMAPGDGSLRNEELVGDGSGVGKQGSTGRKCKRILGHRGGNWGGSAGAKTEDHRAQRRPPKIWKPKGDVRCIGGNKMETLNRADNKSDSAVMK